MRHPPSFLQLLDDAERWEMFPPLACCSLPRSWLDSRAPPVVAVRVAIVDRRGVRDGNQDHRADDRDDDPAVQPVLSNVEDVADQEVGEQGAERADDQIAEHADEPADNGLPDHDSGQRADNRPEHHVAERQRDRDIRKHHKTLPAVARTAPPVGRHEMTTQQSRRGRAECKPPAAPPGAFRPFRDAASSTTPPCNNRAARRLSPLPSSGIILSSRLSVCCTLYTNSTHIFRPRGCCAWARGERPPCAPLPNDPRRRT